MIAVLRRLAPTLCVLAAAAVLPFAPLTAARADGPETTAARVARTHVLRVGVIAGAVPYFSRNLASGQWEGFGPGFAESLAQSLGAKPQYVETTWGNAPLDLQANKIDVMFGLQPTPKRAEVVNFSGTLFDNTFTAICRGRVAPKTWAELDDPAVRIALDVGSSHDQFVTATLPRASVQRLESSPAATMAVQAGKADCQILVVLLAKPLLHKRASIGTLYVPTPVHSAPTAIGLQKEDDPAFRTAVDQWLARARADGQVRGVILKNMEALAGVPASDFPESLKF